jgi:argininosuccinate lyase
MSRDARPTGLWGGRFTEPLAQNVQSLNTSFPFDRRLAAVDIEGSVAYASALREAGWLEQEEHQAIVSGLGAIADEFAEGTFEPHPGDEDIHTAVERRLHELIGSAAGKLHAGRSRNDQVATDLRLYLVRMIDELCDQVRWVQEEIVIKAEGHMGVIMPGYTHLQPAQPILFSHWLMSFFWKLERDHERLSASRRRTNVCPLGSGALTGNPLGVDRDGLVTALGFDAVTQNSVDAVEDRDFVCEFLFAAALLQTHLSSLAETLILWSSEAFDFVVLHERHCTGSSLMPQKRNPDVLELVRGKTGRVFGHLSALLTTLKGLPSGYNKDLQEDKEGLFNVIDTLNRELPIVADVVRRMKVNAASMAAARSPSLLATDVADYLVRKGVPFREAHHAVGQVVLNAEKLGSSIDRLPLAAYRAAHPGFDKDVYEAFDVHLSVSHRAAKGGTAPRAVEAQLAQARAILGKDGSRGLRATE